MATANVGSIAAAVWADLVRKWETPDFGQMWVRSQRHHINAMGAATRPTFGLLTPTTLTDDELWERM